MSRAKVSVVVPTRNCRHTVSALLDSLRVLDYSNYEVIVVDSSDDGTDRIVSKYDVKLIRTPINGPNAARNIGIHTSIGDIICFTDGDCEVPPDWITRIICEFEKDSRIGCVGGSVLPSLDSFLGRYSVETLVSIFPRYTEVCVFAKDQVHDQPFTQKRYPVSCNLAFRRHVLEKSAGFNEKFWGGWEEFELLYRVLDQGYSIVASPRIVVYHRPRSSLLGMLRQAYGYGKGAGEFGKLFLVPNLLRNKVSHSIFKMHSTMPHCLKLFRKTRRLSVLLYPFVDVVIGGSYYIGLIRSH